MKYGNYKTTSSNIGDYIQILAIDYIYEQMNIDKNEIVYVDINDLRTYDGDYIILPIAFAMLLGFGGSFQDNFSNKIFPVFICFYTNMISLSKKDIEFFKANEPIGCRDIHTMQLLRKYNIISYVNGCITAVFPQSTIDRTKLNNVYLVDAPITLESYIPNDIKANAVTISHIVTKSKTHDLMKLAIEMLNNYKNDARMVITSRLHCAVPCIAFGIPVVFACNCFLNRFYWIDKLLRVYTPDDFSNIDWNPFPVQYENIKSSMLDNVISLIKNAFLKYNASFSMSYFFENKIRTKPVTTEVNGIINFINKKWNAEDDFTYSFWGFTEFSREIYRYISEKYPNASLKHIYEKRRVEFESIISEDISNIADNQDFIFIGIISEQAKALNFLDDLGRSPETYVFINMPVQYLLSV